MCAQYTVKVNAAKIAKRFGAKVPKGELQFKERVVPFRPGPVVVQEKKDREVRLMNFSLIPGWMQGQKPKFATHNARLFSEDGKTPIYQKPTWRGPFAKRHCLVPMSAFIEPIYTAKLAGNMVAFEPKGDELITAAGLWDESVNKDTGEVIQSFTILTDDPVPFVKSVGHDRTPVFLVESAFSEWLSPSESNPAKLIEFLRKNRQDLQLSTSIDRALKEGWEKRA